MTWMRPDPPFPKRVPRSKGGPKRPYLKKPNIPSSMAKVDGYGVNKQARRGLTPTRK